LSAVKPLPLPAKLPVNNVAALVNTVSVFGAQFALIKSGLPSPFTSADVTTQARYRH